jgi:hypothetical protein
MRALYDCGRYLTSFNFFEWLVQAEYFGATRVVFDIRRMRGDKWPVEVSRKRFYSILQPGPALAALPQETFDGSRSGGTNAKDIAEPGGRPLVNFWRSGKRFKRLVSPKPKGNARYTVTLRKTQRAPGRNSNDEAWLRFAREIGARVFPDYEDAPVHLHDRVAAYAGAEMNFFVSNGPGVLCSFTEYPCMLFNTHHAAGSLLGDGIGYGEQYPWMLENQRAIWNEDTYEVISRHFEYWLTNGRFIDEPAIAATA